MSENIKDAEQWPNAEVSEDIAEVTKEDFASFTKSLGHLIDRKELSSKLVDGKFIYQPINQDLHLKILCLKTSGGIVMKTFEDITQITIPETVDKDMRISLGYENGNKTSLINLGGFYALMKVDHNR